MLQFTSGSTARPKGVVLTHGNLVANSIAIVTEGLAVRDGDHCVSWLPLYHDMGLIGFVVAALVGTVPTTYIPTTLFLRRPAIWLRILSRHKGTMTYAPNFAYALAAAKVRPEDVADIDLSSVRVAGCGAEPIQAETLRAFLARYGSVGFREEAFVPSYGMAESSLGIAFGEGIPAERLLLRDLTEEQRAVVADDAVDDLTVELVGCGTPFSGHALRIVSTETGEDLPPRYVGEIVVKGPSVTSGYFRDPVQTRAVLSEDGWLRTGDLGYQNEAGQLFVCGRVRDLIIVNGRNFYPQDVEWATASVEGVRLGSVVAFGVPSRDGATEGAVVVAESKLWRQPEQRERLIAEVRGAVQRMVGLPLDEVVLVPSRTIPKTTSGKVQRARTRSLYLSGTLLERSAPAKAPTSERAAESAATSASSSA
jgi:acyl-CoA synthetase (AMP-forming)/AMP-acid ligase II